MPGPSYIFVLKGSPPVALDGFDAFELGGPDAIPAFEGRCGGGEFLEQLHDIKLRLHESLEHRLRARLAGRGFYLRLVAAALIFVASYFFLSAVVRDPLPLVDELLISGALALGLYSFLRRRTERSGEFHRRLVALRAALDRTLFVESPVIDYFEALADECLALGPAVVHKPITPPTAFTAWEREEALALCAALARRYGGDRQVVALYETARKGGKDAAPAARLYKRRGGEEGARALAYLRLLEALSLAAEAGAHAYTEPRP